MFSHGATVAYRALNGEQRFGVYWSPAPGAGQFWVTDGGRYVLVKQDRRKLPDGGAIKVWIEVTG